MKTFAPGLQDHLDTGTTTLCFCWKLVRSDGAVLGFTDHDRALLFDNTSFEPATGFSASAIEASLGLSVDNLNAIGALSASAITEADLAAGIYDDAEIEIFRVNWDNPSQRVLLRRGNLGEVKRGRLGFEAEIRGLAHRLNQPVGRVYQIGCDADLGDERCGVALGDPAFTAQGSVADAGGQLTSFTTAGLDGFASGWFERGKLTFTSGANQGQAVEVKRHLADLGAQSIELWREMPNTISSGDEFTVTAGCDKQFSTCRDKFDNVVSFRGFPHMPGNDFVLSYPDRGGTNDGSSRQR